MSNEADTCREFVLPKLQAVGWDTAPCTISEQCIITAGRIIVTGTTYHRRKQKRIDYLLRLGADYPVAVVEAKASYKTAGAGLQQAKEYAELLKLSFCYATNGHTIIEFDFLTGLETELPSFPTPAELWARVKHRNGLSEDVAKRLLAPYYPALDKDPRYYQRIAINSTVEAILQGDRRILLTMATSGAGTSNAFRTWNRKAPSF